MSVPNHITFTGLDEKTDMSRVVALSAQYHIEWGILFGGRLGKNRYPPKEIVHAAVSTGVALSMHLCGPVANDANNCIPPLNYQGFGRVQVNRAAGQYNIQALSGLSSIMQVQIIVQHRSSTFDVMPEGIVPLQDTSGGKGVTPSFWAAPAYPQQIVGYAGGLNPDNVAHAVRHMPAKNFWIDMETGVRTNDWLDLDKCEAVCRAVYGKPQKGGAA